MAVDFNLNIGDISAIVISAGVVIDVYRHRIKQAEVKGREDKQREEMAKEIQDAFIKIHEQEKSIVELSDTQIKLVGYIETGNEFMKKIQTYMETNIGTMADINARVKNLEDK